MVALINNRLLEAPRMAQNQPPLCESLRMRRLFISERELVRKQRWAVTR